MNPQAEKRIVRARSILIQTQPFLGVLAMRLTLIERPDIETMATDGESLFYCASYVLSLSDSELLFVVAHEIAHCVYSHHARIGNRDLGEFNIAADYAVNRDLVALKIGAIPQGLYLDAKYDGLGAEEIYAARQAARRKAQAKPQPGAGAPQPSQGASAQPGAPSGQPSQAPGQPSPSNAPGQPGAQPSQGQGAPASASQGAPGPSAQPGAGNAQAGAPATGIGQSGASGPGKPGAGAETYGIGGIIKPGNGGDADAAQSADKWQVWARQAASVAAAQNAGTMPGFIEKIIADISAPVVDYRDLLADLINSRVAVDYSFSRPNRRLIQSGFYLPGIVSDAIDHLIFAVDTSGSIDQTMTNNAASEIIGAMESGKIRKLTVLFADTRVANVQEFELGDEIKLIPAGGGGTRFDATFRWIEENAQDATAIIYLTDMECNHWGEEPGAPVYWAVHGDSRQFDRLAAKAPFGDAVYIGRLG